MSEKMISINDVEICTETFGNPREPAVLLMMGAKSSMIWWDEEFCDRLAGKGRFVIRYDNRDVGKSTVYEQGKIGYSLVDMVDDAAGILDAYHLKAAHIVGMSLGGMLAQILSLRYPDRVLTTTMIATSMIGPHRSELPTMDPKIREFHSTANSLDWNDQESVVEYTVESWRLLHGSKHDFDEKRIYTLAKMDYHRANNLQSQFNHALVQGGEEYVGKINEITAPTLVIHGTEDPVLPYDHGVALAKEIPDAKLLTLEGVGHELHYEDWDTIIAAIVEHTEIIKN
ncbi:alpha/beta fold hydrolase [Robertmurraya kyonggiensis]|uniref:Alpha/beta hydrolase n=1 Tax=Robertmurraya kyonggiensis TaxID=1037680 RepID=A0A4U1D365_9BACI|nr:alpha/beta hydrolase [Robertmurraya kyonggiensis]TKC16173.1 alpha/beta hydrolase [Robertmurraya kyonggiensis]